MMEFSYEYSNLLFAHCCIWRHYKTIMFDTQSHIFRETPLRSPYTPRHQHSNYIHSTPNAHLNNDMYPEEGEHIYGTTIRIRKAMASIEKFVLDFEHTSEVEGEVVSEKIYRRQLNDLDNEELTLFIVDGRHIKEFDRELYLQFVFYPAEMISCFDDVVKALYEKYFVEPETDPYTRSRRQNKKPKLMMEIKHLDD